MRSICPGPVPLHQYIFSASFAFFVGAMMLVPLALFILTREVWMVLLCTALVVLFASMGMSFIEDYRRAVRKQKGWCVGCGYDLTGNISGVCPECGAAVKAR